MYRLTPRPDRRLVAGLVVLVVLAAACGSGGGDGPELASLAPAGESAAGGTESDGSAADGDFDEADLTRLLEDYRDCMVREAPPGVEVNVSLDGGEPNIEIDGEIDDDAPLVAAEETCQPILADLEAQFIGSPAEIAERRDRSLIVQRCLAEKGIVYTIDDATGFLGYDSNDQDNELPEEEVVAAEAECEAAAGSASGE